MLALPFRNMPIVNNNPLIKIKLDENSPIGLHIRKKRLQLQMKQGDVAKFIGVTESCIWNWENLQSESMPMIHCMPKIIEFLGYNPIKIDTSTLSGRIKKYRIEHGLSTSGFGELVGVDGSTIGAWEAKTSFPRPSKMEALERIMGKVETEMAV